jgi:hypothetical protein
MLSPLETGTTLGATPGTWEEPGNRVPRTDAWHRRSARGASKARQLAGPGVAMPDKAPHLIHGGPCLILPGRNVFFQDRHAGDRQNASRDDPGHGREHWRGPTRPRRDQRQQARKPPSRTARPKVAASVRGRVLARSHPRQVRSLMSGRGLCHRRRRRADRLLSFGPARGLLTF